MVFDLRCDTIWTRRRSRIGTACPGRTWAAWRGRRALDRRSHLWSSLPGRPWDTASAGGAFGVPSWNSDSTSIGWSWIRPWVPWLSRGRGLRSMNFCISGVAGRDWSNALANIWPHARQRRRIQVIIGRRYVYFGQPPQYRRVPSRARDPSHARWRRPSWSRPPCRACANYLDYTSP